MQVIYFADNLTASLLRWFEFRPSQVTFSKSLYSSTSDLDITRSIPGGFCESIISPKIVSDAESNAVFNFANH